MTERSVGKNTWCAPLPPRELNPDTLSQFHRELRAHIIAFADVTPFGTGYWPVDWGDTPTKASEALWDFSEIIYPAHQNRQSQAVRDIPRVAKIDYLYRLRELDRIADSDPEVLLKTWERIDQLAK